VDTLARVHGLAALDGVWLESHLVCQVARKDFTYSMFDSYS